jgi:hypothetical protein
VIINLSHWRQREGPYEMVWVRFNETLVTYGVGTASAIARLSPFAGHGGHRLVGKDGQKKLWTQFMIRGRHVLLFRSGTTQDRSESSPQYTVVSLRIAYARPLQLRLCERGTETSSECAHSECARAAASISPRSNPAVSSASAALRTREFPRLRI